MDDTDLERDRCTSGEPRKKKRVGLIKTVLSQTILASELHSRCAPAVPRISSKETSAADVSLDEILGKL